MAQLRPKIVKLAKVIGGASGIIVKIDENAPEYYCMADIVSDDEADIARKQSLAADFRIIDPRMSIVSDCFKSFREKNIFTHNIAYPVASAYITSPESAHFSIMDFDESSLPDGVYEILTDMAPKTHKSYVQNQHFAGGN